LGDDYRVALLDEDLYFPDGQIKGEVYEYGSFIQSKMFHAGVRCSDCHDPHTAQLRAEGNRLCTRCHVADKYDSPRHHFHLPQSAGARCVECHMPSRSYMIVDRRRDHSIRVPRPELSITLGTPNACNSCHIEKTAQWAADAIAKWFGPTRASFQEFGPALQAARLDAPWAQRSLAELVSNSSQPAIARATALEILATIDGVSNRDRIEKAAEDSSPLVRRASATMLSSSNPDAHFSEISRLLSDPVRAVRIEAAASLASVPRNRLPASLVGALDHASAEFVSAQELSADRPEAHLNLALFFTRQGKFSRAESELVAAVSLDPSFAPAAINLADLYRQLGREDEAEGVLQKARLRSPDDASLLYALGLLKVRKKENAEARGLFAAAARLDPSNPGYAYVYAIALNDAGNTKAAIETLERAVKLHPYDRDSLFALVGFCEHIGDRSKAVRYARALNALTAEEQAETTK
jgi:predicted CXXCH cytochrome family protein